LTRHTPLLERVGWSMRSWKGSHCMNPNIA
jgi:predicted RNA binding protein YcfA (HicA-like mRNA interferase family)